MASQKDAHLENIGAIHSQLLQALDGMDYCLDWRPDPGSWSAREVVYHLLETPPGGLHSVLRGIFSGELAQFDLWANLSNVTPQRLAVDVEKVREEIGRFFQGMAEAMALAVEGDLEGKAVLVHLRSRGRDEMRTAQMLLEGLFARHWREHLGQIQELRRDLAI